MKKENGLVKLTAFVLLATIIATSLVSGTYAKYTTEKSGTAVATVAKFSVDDNFSAADESFDLFATVYEADATSNEVDVAEGKIAPGTGGSFDVVLTNNSEVTVEARLTIEETENASQIPVEYSLNGEDYVTAANFENVSTLTMTGATKAATTTVYWRWAFEGTDSENYQATQTDSTDTAIGETATAPTITVKATATFTQVD